MSEGIGDALKESGLTLMRKAGVFKAPVHVAVLCPPQAAITVLLNVMLEHGGVYICNQALPMQSSSGLVNGSGHPQIEIWNVHMFSIQQKEFEAWLGCKYDPMQYYAMKEIMDGKAAPR